MAFFLPPGYTCPLVNLPTILEALGLHGNYILSRVQRVPTGHQRTRSWLGIFFCGRDLSLLEGNTPYVEKERFTL